LIYYTKIINQIVVVPINSFEKEKKKKETKKERKERRGAAKKKHPPRDNKMITTSSSFLRSIIILYAFVFVIIDMSLFLMFEVGYKRFTPL